MAHPTILTVILNYRTPDLALDAAEGALIASAAQSGEVVLVDNASGDGSFETMSAEVARRGWGARVRVAQSGRNGGYGAGNNFGMSLALSTGQAPDFFYILNPDAVPDPDALIPLLAYLQAHPDCGMAGSQAVGADGEKHCTSFRFPTLLGEFEGAARWGPITKLLKRWVIPIIPPPDQATLVDWVAGCSVLMRRTMIEETGGFDETFFLYFEETDLCRRATQAGWGVAFVPESRVMHIGSASTGMGAWTRTPQYWFDSRRHYFTKNHGHVYAALATVFRVMGAAVWGLKRLLTRQSPQDPPRFVRDLMRHAFTARSARNPRVPGE